jgi:hypothetical protein
MTTTYDIHNPTTHPCIFFDGLAVEGALGNDPNTGLPRISPGKRIEVGPGETLTNVPMADHVAARLRAIPAGEFLTLTPTRRPAIQGRKRGPTPEKLARVMEAMRGDIREGRKTTDSLSAMKEEALAATYNVSRDTARKARTAVLSKFVENSNRDK